jgi:hypothetical protein
MLAWDLATNLISISFWVIHSRVGRKRCLNTALETNLDGEETLVGMAVRDSYQYFNVLLLITVRHVIRDERKYYEDLLQYSRDHLMVNKLINSKWETLMPSLKVLTLTLVIPISFV